jgi:hypothetical protein
MSVNRRDVNIHEHRTHSSTTLALWADNRVSSAVGVEVHDSKFAFGSKVVICTIYLVLSLSRGIPI